MHPPTERLEAPAAADLRRGRAAPFFASRGDHLIVVSNIALFPSFLTPSPNPDSPMTVPATTPALRPVAPGGALRPSPRGLRARLESSFHGRENNEFLPAHLEILDTPPSPMSLIFLWVIAALLSGALLWSCLASIDIFAVATGRVQPSGRSKIVQPFEISKVQAVLVANGERVAAGAPLVTLDPTEAAADVAAKHYALEAIDAQIARYRAAITAIEVDRSEATPDFDFDVPASIRAQETMAMLADINAYISERDSLVAKRDGNYATEARFVASIAARQRLLAVLQDRAHMKQSLVETASGTKAALIDAMQQVEQASADLAYDQGQLGEAKAAAVTSDRAIQQTKSEALAKQSQMLVNALEKRPSAKQDLIKSALRQARMTLTSPIAGTVQQLAVTTVGQVVTPGQPLVVIVPMDGPIEIEARVENKDIGFVTLGQEAIVKVDAFPFTRYGTLDGKVAQVSRDAIEAREANASSDAESVARGQSVDQTTGTAPMENLVYPVKVDLDRDTIAADGKDVRLTPGMTVSVEILTGHRRVIDYLLAPILETTSTAGHER